MSIANVFWLSFDSLVVSLALGPLLRLPSACIRLALAFGACDALAYVIGGALGWHVGGEWVRQAGAVLVFSYGLYVLAVAAWSLSRVGRWLIWVMPLFMSLDNLAFGAANPSSSLGLAQRAFLLGIASGALALTGLLLSSAIGRFTRCSAEWLAGAGLLLAFCILLFN
jgi:putative Mn2+ efflux pump MntP